MKVNYDLPSSNNYFELINKTEELSEEENKKIQAVNAFVADAIKYKDYLLKPQKNYLDTYERGMNDLAIYESENPENSLTMNQKFALDEYQKHMNYRNDFEKEKTRILAKKNNDVSSGYANAFILILTVLATGILIGMIIFSLIK